MTQTLTASPIAAIFDQWAEVYDTQPNPLLQLEERTLVLPDLTGFDILDVGCGTGRWLHRLEAHAPHSLAGTDCSQAMLNRARPKLSPLTTLHKSQGDPSQPVVPRAVARTDSRDLILGSFLLSYIEDLAAFASECFRILRPGGKLIFSDMHPTTSIDCNWSRSFHHDGTKVYLPALHRSLPQIIDAFTRCGLHLETLAEPSFAEPERPIFEQADKLEDYLSLVNVPAIYALKFYKAAGQPYAKHGRNKFSPEFSKLGGTALAVKGHSFPATEHSSTDIEELDLSSYTKLPGLINAHDHLEFSLYPNLGHPPYPNSPAWAADIHRTNAALIAKHRAVPLETRLWFGAIRNLLCGVTTVCHHNYLHPELTSPDFPIRVVHNFTWGHSLTFDPGLAARKTDYKPFILHAAEGTDAESRAELAKLDRLSLLDEKTILVHGLALITRDIDLLNNRGAALVFCPTSNQFLFGHTPPTHIIRQTRNAALGSDSPLTAAGDLLDEIALLRARGLDSATLSALVTTNPARILGLAANNDFIAVRGQKETPEEAIATLTLEDIELVFINNQVQVTSPTLYEQLPPDQKTGLYLLKIAGLLRWVRGPLPELFASAEEVLGKGNLRLGNKEVRLVDPR